MNWRRGLFRLWIVGSTLFVIAVAVISYGDIKYQFVEKQLPVEEKQFPVLCTEARGGAGADYVIKEQHELKPSQTCWYVKSKFRMFYPEYTDLSDYKLAQRLSSKLRTFYPGYADLSDDELARKLYAAHGLPIPSVLDDLEDLFPDPILRRPSPWATVGIWAAVAFGIPLVALLLGAALLWAFSGFAKASRSSPLC